MARTAAQRAYDEQRVELALLGRLLPTAHDKRLHAKVAGVKHPNEDGSSRQEAIAKLHQFDSLELERRPNDEFDENAIAVLAEIAGERVQVGFIPADLARELAPAIDAGETWKAIATRVTDHITRGVSLMAYRIPRAARQKVKVQ